MEKGVRSHLIFRQIIGHHSIYIGEDETIKANKLLTKLSQTLDKMLKQTIYNPQTKILGDKVTAITNGHSYIYQPDKLDTEKKDRGEVAIFPSLAWGYHFRTSTINLFGRSKRYKDLL